MAEHVLGFQCPVAHLRGALEQRTSCTTVCSDLAGSKRILETEESPSAKALRWEGTLEGMKRAPLVGAKEQGWWEGSQGALSTCQLALMHDSIVLMKSLPAHQGLLRNTEVSLDRRC